MKGCRNSLNFLPFVVANDRSSKLRRTDWKWDSNICSIPTFWTMELSQNAKGKLRTSLCQTLAWTAAARPNAEQGHSSQHPSDISTLALLSLHLILPFSVRKPLLGCLLGPNTLSLIFADLCDVFNWPLVSVGFWRLFCVFRQSQGSEWLKNYCTGEISFDFVVGISSVRTRSPHWPQKSDHFEKKDLQ